MKGRIIVLTGDGKGKTTAALGMALRAAGHGKRAVVVQFLKRGAFGETKIAVPHVEVHQFGTGEFVGEPEREDYEGVERALRFAGDVLSKQPFLLVLDEVNVALAKGLLSMEQVKGLLSERGATHVVLTGRNAPEELLAAADIATEMHNITHDYERGRDAVEGIEY